MRVPVRIAAALPAIPPAAPGTTTIRAGLVIHRNTTLRRDAYRIQSADLEAPVITIRGSNIEPSRRQTFRLRGDPERETTEPRLKPGTA